MEYGERIALLCITLIFSFASVECDTISACTSTQIFYFGRRGVFQCSFEGYYAWYWYNTTDSKEATPFASYDVESGTTIDEAFSEEFDLLRNGSLVINNVSLSHEHAFRVLMLADKEGGSPHIEDIKVKVRVKPRPGYPVVEGCSNHQDCVLNITKEGYLTCSLYGIRPSVHLEWGASPDSRIYISFSDKQMTIQKNRETFDVTTTIFYVLHKEAQGPVNVECKAVQNGTGLSGFSGLSTTVKLHPLFDIDVTLFPTTFTTAVVAADVGNTSIVVLVVACSFSIVVIVITVFIITTRKLKGTTKERKHSREGTNEEKEEEVPLNKKQRTSGSKTETWTHSEKTSEDESDNSPETKKKQKPDKFKVLLEELKDKYEDIYRSVQPIPYLRDKLCVNDVFVEFGIEYNLDKDNKGEWKGLDSYSCILELPGTTSKKIIIEADPGFGKSTLTTQMLYDWCSSNETYLSQNIDLLIFLRLRQLGGFSSIYLAVKSLLLAKDSSLSDSDIKQVLQSDSVSVCFILDGYDEYSHHNTKSDSDIVSIIEGKLFRPSLVILTTRTAILPKRYLQKTAFVRLTGFNDKSRNDYIKKAIVGKDKDAGERISQRLKETPILGDLCEVPLFFAIFAQMAHTGEDTKTLNTVTKFFRFMISCFNRHMQNKMEDENTELLTDFNDEHSELDKLAFEGLLGKEQNIMWDKKVLCQKLSGTVYEKYKKIGILMEEEILEIADDNATSDMDIIGNKTMVRFYHKLFCEWYAAKHLAKFAATEDRMTVWDTLNQLNFIDLQYVYRFACGINVKAAERIVKFLNESEARKEFVILCIMEQKTFSENTLQLARSLCSQHITFKENDDLFLQRCLSQFLQVSSNENIIISNVWLRNVFNSVDMERNCILLKKNIILPSLDTLIALHLLEEHKNLSLEDMAHVLKYVLLCAGIKEIWFRLCFLPSSFTEKNILVDLKKRDIAVYWCPTSRGTFILDSQNGWWQQEDGRVLNDIEYMKVEAKWN